METAPVSLERLIIFVVSFIFLAAYIIIRWRRTSSYVDGRNAYYSELRIKENAYTERAKQDARWPGFIKEIQKRRPVSERQATDDDTYQVHYINILDTLQMQYEPNQPGSENASIYAFLKRKSNPKYIQFEMTPEGEIIERKITGGQWYDLFERSI